MRTQVDDGQEEAGLFCMPPKDAPTTKVAEKTWQRKVISRLLYQLRTAWEGIESVWCRSGAPPPDVQVTLRSMATRMRRVIEGTDGVALEQLFEGEVAEINDGTVIIEFDEGVRRFQLKDLHLEKPLQVGDAVQVRCQLEVLMPGPLSDVEVKIWEKEHAWARDPRLKAEPGEPLK